MVARVDEEVVNASRAPDAAYEAHAAKLALINSRRAERAFTESLKHDKLSLDSALAHFGKAECLTSEALYLEKVQREAKANGGPDVSERLAKVKKQAHRSYGAALARDPEVVRKYDRLLPEHLDAEGAKTLPAFHARHLTVKQKL